MATDNADDPLIKDVMDFNEIAAHQISCLVREAASYPEMQKEMLDIERRVIEMTREAIDSIQNQTPFPARQSNPGTPGQGNATQDNPAFASASDPPPPYPTVQILQAAMAQRESIRRSFESQRAALFEAIAAQRKAMDLQNKGGHA